jgi:PAS domain S-box-containing protein
MTWQQAPEIVPLFISAALCAGLGVFAWAHRRVPAATGFVVLMASCAWWSFFYAVYRAATTLEAKLFLAMATQAGAIVVPLAWMLFTLQYTRRERWLTPGRIAAVSAVPLLTLAMALTNPIHHQFWAVFTLVPRSGYIHIDSREAWGFWLHVGYSWALLSACVALLALQAFRSVRLYQRQAVSIFVAALVPWVGNVLHVGKMVRFPANPMPVLFTLSGVIFFWAIFRLRLLDVMPVAREALVEELPDGVLVLDDGDRVIDLNPAARALLGVPGDEWLGRRAEEVLPALAPLLATARQEHRVRGEVEMSGDHHAVDVRVTRLHDDRGTPAGRLVVLRDLTERERREGALTLQRAYLGQLFEASPEAIALLDGQDRVMDVNGEFTRMFGYTAADAKGKPINSLIVPGWLSGEGDELTQQVMSGVRVGMDTTRAHRDGTTLDVHVTGTPVFVDGRQVAIWAIYRDITRRKANERVRAELLEREREARAAAEAAGRRASFLADVGTLLSASFDYGSSYRELARLAVPELADYCLIDVVEPDGGTRRVAVAHHDPVGETHLLHDTVNPPDADPERRPVLRVVRTGEPLLVPEFTPEMRELLSHDERHRESFLRNDLRSFIIVPLTARGRTLGAITLAMSDSGRRYAAADLAVAQDMARRAALAIDNARLYREAREAVRARDSVLGVVSHDLRNPLTAILLNADSIFNASSLSLPSWVYDGLGMIVRSAEAMEHLIRDLLDVARIESGQLRVSPQPHDPGRLVQDATELFTPLAEERGVHLVGIPPERAPLVRADRDRALQVFSNLVGNALKFTPPEGIVTVGAVSDGGAVRFWVRDTGPGIPESEFPLLFDRFWQGAGRRDGAGLGLPIAKGIVEAHGGRVWVESEIGVGTTFHFTLG